MIKYTLLLLLLISPAISLQAKEIKIGIFDFAPWGMQVADRVTGIVWQQAWRYLNRLNLPQSRISLLTQECSSS